MKAAGAISDPLLGPYAAMLDLYSDPRSSMGLATFPTTTAVEPPAP